MTRATLFLCILISLYSCEPKEDNPESSRREKFNDTLNTDFNTKILEGYFVTAMAYDSLGNAWIGTFSQGLIKYSNGETQVYNTSNSDLPDDGPFWDIAVDSKNNIWMGGDALIKFDGNRFTSFNSGNSKIPEDNISSVAVDSKDNVWFSSCRFREGGIVKYDGIDFTVYTPDNSPLPASLVHGIAIDINDVIWIALTETVSQTYLVRISGGKWRIFTGNEIGFSPYYIGNIGINSDNKVCASIDYSLSSTWVNLGPQVFIFNGVASQKLRFDSITRVKSVTVDRSDHLWCATYRGYAVYDGKNWTVDDTTLGDESVFAIEQAPDHKIWIGTGNGVFINE
jgi:ligand-binding sensor domain-containing protein